MLCQLLIPLFVYIPFLAGPPSPAPDGAGCQVQALFSPTDDIAVHLFPLLDGARHSIHCSLFGISNHALTVAMVAAADRGVQVVIGLDHRQSALASDRHALLRRHGATVVVKPTVALEHNKFCIVDGDAVVMGSWNFSESAQHQDNSVVLLTGCPAVSDAFEAAFRRILERDLP